MTKKKAAQGPALDTGRMDHVRLDLLAVSPFNVRSDAEVGPDDELVHSIRAHGLLQPLIGHIARTGAALVQICAGQRRLLALRHLAAGDTLIPVRIVDEQTAIEVSLAENLERKSMNAADELAAFRALIDTGSYDANRIADRFGFDRRTVRRRLKMSVLHPDILAALREGAIGVAAAEAYAASDDHNLQLQVFKEQSRPNFWNPHAPFKILDGYACAGIGADSGVGKFIGGVAAYEAAGGSCARDDAFSELFAENALDRGPRLTDPVIVRKLLDKAQADAQADVESLAAKQAPFASAVLWCDANGNSPKPAKDSGLVALRTGWDAAAGEYRDDKSVRKIAEKIAKAGGTVHALAMIGREGEPEIVEQTYFVTKATLDEVTPKVPDPRQSMSTMSAEDRAALDRQHNISRCAVNLYARSLIGDTPGFVVSRATPYWGGGIEIELIEPKAEKLSWADLEMLAAPFVEQATQQIDAAAAAAPTEERPSAEAAEAEDVEG